MFSNTKTLPFFPSKTLKKMKDLNARLNEQISRHQKRIATLESENETLTSDQKYSTLSQQQQYDSEQRKDAELRRTKRENEELREQIASLEREKRRVERSYVNLEKDLYTSSRSAGGGGGGGGAVQMGPLASHHHQYKQTQTHLRRTPSPATTVSVATNTTAADQSSLFSASRLLSDPTALLSSSTTIGASTKMNFSKVTRGLEQLEQHHMEIQQKVLGLENLIETASSEGDLNATRQSGEDFTTDYRMTRVETGSFKSDSSGGHHHHHHQHQLDYNGNVNEAIERKLKLAQMKAQSLIDASSSFEKEVGAA